VGYVKLTGSANRHESWTSEFVLERDEETGEPTKVVKLDEPIDLTKDEQERVEALGGVFEKSSADEAKEVEESDQPVGADVANAGPRFGGSSEPNQTTATPDDKGEAKKN
jgi:hypothetical protein